MNYGLASGALRIPIPEVCVAPLRAPSWTQEEVSAGLCGGDFGYSLVEKGSEGVLRVARARERLSDDRHRRVRVAKGCRKTKLLEAVWLHVPSKGHTRLIVSY